MKTTKEHMKLLKLLLNSEISQVSFLTQLEATILENEGLLKQTVKYLKFLYDQDLTEEGAVLKWFSLGSEEGELNVVKKKAKPFVEWLETADEESD